MTKNQLKGVIIHVDSIGTGLLECKTDNTCYAFRLTDVNGFNGQDFAEFGLTEGSVVSFERNRGEPGIVRNVSILKKKKKKWWQTLLGL